MNVNDRVLHITGGASITEDLELETTYLLSAEITTKSVGDQRSNGDGTVNLHTKAGITGLVVLTKGDKVIEGHAKTSKASQKLRFEIEARADKKGVDREQYYQSLMSKIIDRIDEVDIFLNK